MRVEGSACPPGNAGRGSPNGPVIGTSARTAASSDRAQRLKPSAATCKQRSATVADEPALVGVKRGRRARHDGALRVAGNRGGRQHRAKGTPSPPGVGPVAMEERGAVPGTEPELTLYPAGDELPAEGRPLRDVEAAESVLGGRGSSVWVPARTAAVRKRLWVTVRKPR